MYNSKTITQNELCKLFDHTNLSPYANVSMFEDLCREAKELNCAMVAINSAPVPICRDLLKNTGIHVGAAVSFPLGQTTIETKVFEAINAIENGADEIDYVINIGELKNGNLDYIKREMTEMVNACHLRNVLIKVIFENCYLTKDEIVFVAAIAKEVKPDFIKTSTGFGTSGATAEDVRLMKETAGSQVKVKAAGGIRSWTDCKAMIDAGAERIGTSSSLKILKEFLEERRKEG